MLPVAMKTGYIDHYDAEESRQQVIVIMRQDWTVACYDAQLELMWERGVSHQTAHDLENILEKYEMIETSIFITPTDVQKNQSGSVFVGVRVRLNDETATNIRIEGFSGMHVSGDKEHPDMKLRGELEHFTVHALDGHTGKIMWLHDGSEQRTEDFKKSLPHQALQREARDLSRQVHRTAGGNDWTVFKGSILHELPHRWTSISDSSFRLAHFVRKHLGAGSGTQKSPSKLSSSHAKKAVAEPKLTSGTKKQVGKLLSGRGRFLGVESHTLSQDAVLPHDASEHTDNPNVIVAHTRYGIEVFALKGGDFISSLALPEGRLSGDVDGDGIVDTVLVLQNDDEVAAHGSMYAHVGKSVQRCTLMVVSGLPPTAQLFNGSLCSNKRSLVDPTPDVSGSSDSNPPAISATTPVLLRKLDYATGGEARDKDVCVAVNTGVVTCFSGSSGEVQWQSLKNPGWKSGFSFATLDQFVADAEETDEVGGHDLPMSMLFVAGDMDAALVDRDSGATLTSIELPYPPSVRPVFGDFDNDGVNDVIIVSSESLFGYRMKVSASSQGMLITIIVLLVLASIIFVA
ncbi:unnamed protein product, partial [Ectocarpus fasciculatus]